MILQETPLNLPEFRLNRPKKIFYVASAYGGNNFNAVYARLDRQVMQDQNEEFLFISPFDLFDYHFTKTVQHRQKFLKYLEKGIHEADTTIKIICETAHKYTRLACNLQQEVAFSERMAMCCDLLLLSGCTDLVVNTSIGAYEDSLGVNAEVILCKRWNIKVWEWNRQQGLKTESPL